MTQTSTDNDPLRRASPAHEALGWRTRVLVTSYAELEYHVAYPLDPKSVAYMRMRDVEAQSGVAVQLIDIYHPADGDVEQALVDGTDLAEVLVDLLALTGYGAARIQEIVSTTVPFCRADDPYPLATFGASIQNTPVPVTPSHFEAVRSETVGRLALRHLRDGLSATLPTVSFASFWNSIERQAEDVAKEQDLRRKLTCQNCGHERTEGWNTKHVIEGMYKDAGLDPQLFDKHRQMRGTIQHGGKLRTIEHVREIQDNLPQVQIAATVAVAKRLEVAPATSVYMSGNWPVTVFSCRTGKDKLTNVDFKKMGVQAASGKLPDTVAGNANRTLQAAVFFPVQINPFALPPLDE